MTHIRPHVLVADDEKDTREALVRRLTHLGCEAFGAADGEQALALAANHAFDVALVDALMPPPAGLELARLLKEAHPQIEIVIVTACGSMEYKPRPLQPETLVARIHETSTRSTKAAPAESKPGSLPFATLKAALDTLTRREREVLEFLAAGCSDREIAEQLKISFHTVRAHVRQIRRKLDVQNRIQAALIARKFGKNTAFE